MRLIALLFLLPCPVFGAQWWVSPTGSDTNAGSQTAPWTNLRHALGQASHGDTIWLRGGVHRTDGANLRARTSGNRTNYLRLWAWPGESPILSGAVEINEWERVSGAPVIRVPSICDYAPITADPAAELERLAAKVVLFAPVPGTTLIIRHKTDYRHGQLFATVDEVPFPLRQVGWSSLNPNWIYRAGEGGEYHLNDKRGSVKSGEATLPDRSFVWADGYLYARLELKTNQSTHVVIEGSERIPLHLGAVDHVHLKGITFRHSSTLHIGRGSVGVAIGTNSIMEDCTVEWMDCDGLHASRGAVVSNCVIRFNGRTGFQAGHGPFQLVNSLVQSNNWRCFEQCDHAAGAKIIGLVDYSGSVLSGNRFVNNCAKGLWFDSVHAQRGVEVFGNEVTGNFPQGPYAQPGSKGPCPPFSVTCYPGGGIRLENSGGISVYNNLVLSNSPPEINPCTGIQVDSSTNCFIAHNTVVVGGRGVGFSMLTQPGRPVPVENRILNNVFVRTHWQTLWVIEGGRTIGDTFIDGLERNIIDGNAYWQTDNRPMSVNFIRDSGAPGRPCSNLSQPCLWDSYLAQVRPFWETTGLLLSPTASVLDGQCCPLPDSGLLNRALPVQHAASFVDARGRLREGGPDVGALELPRRAGLITNAVEQLRQATDALSKFIMEGQ